MRAISAEASGKAGAGDINGRIADAPSENWVDRFAPVSLKPWLRLMRADRPIGAWLLMWPCWWSVALAVRAEDDFPAIWFDIKLLLLFTIGAFAMRSAGCIYNDIIDRDIDAKVARTKGRPLASGQISLSAAIACTLALCLAGLAVLLQFGKFTVTSGFVSVGIVLIYPLMKRVTFWPQAVLGLAFSYGALMGWVAYWEDRGFNWGNLGVPPIVLYVASIAWTIGYDTIYAHQDKEDDLMVGLKSTALRFGKSTPAWLSLFYGVAIGGLVFAGWVAGAGIWFFCGLAIAAGQLLWQVATLNIEDPKNCLERFRSNRLFGAIVFLAFVADIVPLALK